MRKEIRTRLALYGLYAALAFLFFIFGLKTLAWIFGGIVIAATFIGAVIWIWKGLSSCNPDVTE